MFFTVFVAFHKAKRYMPGLTYPLCMPEPRGAWIWPIISALLVLSVAALVGFPLYVHYEVAQSTGAFAPLYLYEYSPYNDIVVEVHYAQDAVPSDDALESLRSMLVNYTGKQVEVTKYADIGNGEVPAQVNDTTVFDFGNGVISRHGHASLGWIGGQIPIYVLYVDASGPQPDNNSTNEVAGISYSADSFIVLKNNVPYDNLEKSVLIHETGHLMGLDHCDDQNCVMTAVLIQKKAWLEGQGAPPTDFCDKHKQELADRRHNLFYNMGKLSENTTAS